MHQSTNLEVGQSTRVRPNKHLSLRFAQRESLVRFAPNRTARFLKFNSIATNALPRQAAPASPKRSASHCVPQFPTAPGCAPRATEGRTLRP